MRVSRVSHADRGAAVVEFVMIAVLLMFVVFAVLQVAVFFYIRDIVAVSAARGARYAANAGTDYALGGVHASNLVRDGLSPAVASAIPCRGSAARDAQTGLTVAVVRCRGHLRSIFLPLGSLVDVDVTSRSLKEGVP